MKYSILIILISLNFLASAQITDDIEKEHAPWENVNNSKTERHKNIPFTHVFLDLPSEYALKKYQTTITKNEVTGIIAMELDGGNFYLNAVEFTESNMQKQGFTVDEFWEFELNGNPAIMCLALSPDQLMKSYQLVTGDSTFCVILIGNSLPGDLESINEIRTMMLSFVYDKSHAINYEAIAPFTYDQDASKFKLARATSTVYLFSIDGVKKDDYEDDPILIVTAVPNEGISPKSLSLNMKNQVQSHGIELSLREDSFEKVNGYKAYEAIYTGKQDGGDLEMYTLTIVNEEHAIVAQGKSKADFENMMIEMKKCAHSIRIK